LRTSLTWNNSGKAGWLNLSRRQELAKTMFVFIFYVQIYAIIMVSACYKYLKERMRQSQHGRCYSDVDVGNGDTEVHFQFSYYAHLYTFFFFFFWYSAV